MKAQYKFIVLLTAFLPILAGADTSAPVNDIFESYTDSVSVIFKQNKWNLNMRLGNNAEVLENIDRKLTTIVGDSIFRLHKLHVIGGASPEGSVPLNMFLSEQRANTLFNWFSQYDDFDNVEKDFTFLGRNWEDVLKLALKDDDIPYRDDTIDLLWAIVSEKRSSGKEPKNSLAKLKRLHYGVPYLYLYNNIFPVVRISKLIIEYDKILSPEASSRIPAPVVLAIEPASIPLQFNIEGNDSITMSQIIPLSLGCKRQWTVGTNLIALGMAITNITGELSVGCRWSTALSLCYSAWNYGAVNHKYRMFMVKPEVRYWTRSALAGLFVEAHLQLTYYNFARPSWNYRIQDTNGTHPALGGGFGVGYRLPIGDRGWALQASLGAGVYHLKYDRFLNYHNGPLHDTHSRTWAGIDHVGIGIIYNFNSRF